MHTWNTATTMTEGVRLEANNHTTLGPCRVGKEGGAVQTLGVTAAHMREGRPPVSSQTALHPGHEEQLLAAKSRGSAPSTHPAAVNDSRAARGPEGRQGGLHGAPACASSPKNSTAVTAFPMVNQSLICSAVSCRSIMASARGPCLAPRRPPRAYTGPLPALGPAPPLARDPRARHLLL